MNKGKDIEVIDDIFGGQWIEDIDAELPEAVAESKKHGRLPDKAKHIKVRLGIRELPDGHEMKFNASLTDTLREVFEHGAQALNKPFLPPGSTQPLDILRFLKRHGEGWSESVSDLERPLWLALAEGFDSATNFL